MLFSSSISRVCYSDSAATLYTLPPCLILSARDAGLCVRRRFSRGGFAALLDEREKFGQHSCLTIHCLPNRDSAELDGSPSCVGNVTRFKGRWEGKTLIEPVELTCSSICIVFEIPLNNRSHDLAEAIISALYASLLWRALYRPIDRFLENRTPFIRP